MATSKTKPFINPFEHEKLEEFPKQAVKNAVNEARKSGLTALGQLGLPLGKSEKSSAEKTSQGKEAPQVDNSIVEIFSLAFHKKTSGEKAGNHTEQAPKPRKEAAINYHGEISKNRERASRSEMHGMKQNIEQIKQELAKLVASSQELKLQFAEVGVDQSETSVGNYHATFFEWMLLVIRNAREKVEDSGSWLGTVKGKGAKKGGGYWGMFKKHGAMFGQSGERSVATNVG